VQVARKERFFPKVGLARDDTLGEVGHVAERTTDSNHGASSLLDTFGHRSGVSESASDGENALLDMGPKHVGEVEEESMVAKEINDVLPLDTTAWKRITLHDGWCFRFCGQTAGFRMYLMRYRWLRIQSPLTIRKGFSHLRRFQ
jgi:hypothetical protein